MTAGRKKGCVLTPDEIRKRVAFYAKCADKRKAKYDQACKLVDSGIKITQVKKDLKISEGSYVRMRKDYGDMSAIEKQKEVKRLERVRKYNAVNALVSNGANLKLAIVQAGISYPTYRICCREIGVYVPSRSQLIESTRYQSPNRKPRRKKYGIFKCASKCGMSVLYAGESCRLCYENELRKVAGLQIIDRVYPTIDQILVAK